MTGVEDPFDTPRLPVADADELAGVVDLFGALTREEVADALVELAYRQRGDVDDDAVAAAAADAVDWAVERYHLVAYDPTEDDPDEAVVTAEDVDETLLTVGPVSFPTLPTEAEDLPHILDYPVDEERSQVDRYAEAVVPPERDDRLPAWTDAPVDPASVEECAAADLREVRD